MDTRILLGGLIAVGLLFAMVLGTLIGTDANLYLVGGLAILIFAVTTPAHGYIAVFCVVVLTSSAFVLPIPGQPRLWEVGAAFAVSTVVSHVVFGGISQSSIKIMQRWWVLLASVSLYCVYLLVLMPFHGVGLNVLGSGTVGGRAYLQQAVLLLYPFAVLINPLSVRTLYWMLILFCLAPISYAVAEVIYLYISKGSPLLLFLEIPSDTAQFTAKAEAGATFQRYQGIGLGATGCVMLVLAKTGGWRLLSLRGTISLLLIIGLSFLVIMTGSRRMILLLCASIAGIVIIDRAITVPRVILGGVLAGCMLIGLYFFAPVLPPAAQRAAAILPGIDVPQQVLSDASGTMAARRELREISKTLAVEYFIEGRGFGISSGDIARQDLNTVERYAAVGNFYSGPISVLVATGIVGLSLYVIAIFASLVLCVWFLKTYPVFDVDGSMVRFVKRIGGIAAMELVYSILLAIFITGDAQTAIRAIIPNVCILFAIVAGLTVSQRKITQPTVAEGL